MGLSFSDTSDEGSVASRQDTPQDVVELTIDAADAGSRLDGYLAGRFPQYSRTHLRRLITASCVEVDGRHVKVAYRLRGGERVRVRLPDLPREGPQPEPMALNVVYEDEHLAVIDKPPNMVVHPSKGHGSGTLAAGLVYHFKSLSRIGGPSRPGIVHRLDRDTSGLIVVAKDDRAHQDLASQFERRTVSKEYLAIVCGKMDRDRDWIRLPIGVHPYEREKMAVRRDHATSREAETFYEVIQRFDGMTLLRLAPKTGRTHQLRVHLSAVGHGVLCDRLYGGRARITSDELARTPGAGGKILLERQALHAARLTVRHPTTGATLAFESPPPGDFSGVLDALRRYRAL